jgi:hypothetical protein
MSDDVVAAPAEVAWQTVERHDELAGPEPIRPTNRRKYLTANRDATDHRRPPSYGG